MCCRIAETIAVCPYSPLRVLGRIERLSVLGMVYQRLGLREALIMKTTKAPKQIKRTIPAVIQIGGRTHHQDQLIFPISFSVMKTIVRRPANPIPPELLLDSLIVTLLPSS
jgi:hypothetical protein